MVQFKQDDEELRLQVVFYRTAHGSEPVREWLKSLSPADKRIIGEDIKTVQFGFPIGMPLVRKLEGRLMGSTIFVTEQNCSRYLHR